MIEIEWDDRRVTKALRDLQDAAVDLTPALLAIKENLVESTKKRFETKTGPDGKRWEENSPVTIDRKGFNDPLVDGGTLNEQISGDVFGGHTLVIYPEMGYAATQQFGAKQGEFGTSKRGGPLPWGDIPARPFMGISFEDDAMILDVIREHLKDAIS